MWSKEIYENEFNLVKDLEGSLNEFSFKINFQNYFVQNHKVKGKIVVPAIFIIEAVSQSISKMFRLFGYKDYYSIVSRIYLFKSDEFLDNENRVIKVKINKILKMGNEILVIAEAYCEKIGMKLKIGIKLYKNVYS